jgi:hypothetical protein
VEVYTAGPAAVEQRDSAVKKIVEEALALGFERRPELPQLELEATLGAIDTVLFEWVRRGGPRSLPGAVPLATYLALAPCVGAEAACAGARQE